VVGGDVKGRELRTASSRVDLRAAIEQQLAHIDVVTVGGNVHWRSILAVAGIYVCPPLQEKRDDLWLFIAHCHMQRVKAIRVLGAFDISALVEQKHDHGCVALEDRNVQGRAEVTNVFHIRPGGDQLGNFFEIVCQGCVVQFICFGGAYEAGKSYTQCCGKYAPHGQSPHSTEAKARLAESTTFPEPYRDFWPEG